MRSPSFSEPGDLPMSDKNGGRSTPSSRSPPPPNTGGSDLDGIPENKPRQSDDEHKSDSGKPAVDSGEPTRDPNLTGDQSDSQNPAVDSGKPTERKNLTDDESGSRKPAVNSSESTKAIDLTKDQSGSQEPAVDSSERIQPIDLTKEDLFGFETQKSQETDDNIDADEEL